MLERYLDVAWWRDERPWTVQNLDELLYHAKRFGDRWQILRDHVQHKNIAHYLDEKANRHGYAPDGVEYNRGLEE